jgi:hypothetical protein
MANRSFENVAKFKYFGTVVTRTKIWFMWKIKSRLNSDNACYNSFQNLLSSRLLYKYLKIKVHRTTILPVAFYGCETWFLTLREE